PSVTNTVPASAASRGTPVISNVTSTATIAAVIQSIGDMPRGSVPRPPCAMGARPHLGAERQRSGAGPMAGTRAGRKARGMDTTDTYDRLVCGLDDSEHAPSVLAVAVELAQRLGLKLRLVHSADPDIFLVGERRRDALRRGAELLDSLVPAGLAHERVI